MKWLFAIQVGLGLLKVVMAFTIGRSRFAWHLASGVVIMVLGVVLLVDHA